MLGHPPLRAACDLYVAAFLSPKPAGTQTADTEAAAQTSPVPTTGAVWQRASDGQVCSSLEDRAVKLARGTAAFHWPIEFPEVMAVGGFDAVLGNPPWDRIKLQEKEFFAARAPEVAAAPNAAERKRMIKTYKDAAPGSRERRIYEAFEVSKRAAEAATVFARVPGKEGGRFPLTGRGDVNTYALFAELFSMLTSPRGRAGMIVPTGIATDATTAPFFANLVEKERLVALYSFREIRQWFTATDDRNPFALLIVGTGSPKPTFAFSLNTTDEIATRRLSLSPADIALVNPNTRTAPIFRAEADAVLTRKIYNRVPVLLRDGAVSAGDPWGVSFMAMFHMSSTSTLFCTAAQLAAKGMVRQGTDWVDAAGVASHQPVPMLAGGRDEGSLPLDGGPCPARHRRYVPLYEAKMVHQFDHRWATYDGADPRDATSTEHADATWEPTPHYWVPEAEVADRLSNGSRKREWLMCWRRNARFTDERTMICAVVPAIGVGDSSFSNYPPPLRQGRIADSVRAWSGTSLSG